MIYLKDATGGASNPVQRWYIQLHYIFREAEKPSNVDRCVAHCAISQLVIGPQLMN
ncbi:hypothetical protein AAC03nite_32790 [Alicyclobacillus acidoterrestris]|nr:hypothetical protein AAC03nite_32790 [Alicyclobacillus acidoterrestris]